MCIWPACTGRLLSGTGLRESASGLGPSLVTVALKSRCKPCSGVDGASYLRNGMALSFPHGPWWPGRMCSRDGHYSVFLPASGLRLKPGLGSEINL